MKKIFILLFALSTALVSNAQQPHRCGADHMHQHLRNSDPEFNQRAEDYNRQIRELIAANRENRVDGDVVVIPIVFHIIHNWGIENISDEQIFDQVRILNEDFRKLNEDTADVIDFFKPIVADSKIEFRLAQRDFEGNCTNGIDRIASTETYVGNDGSKLNPWPRDRYLNVWVVNTMEDGVAGYAYYPSAVPNGISALRDGIIIRHNYIGSIGTATPSLSRALTHEIGHWLNLQHVWGDNNNPGIGCGDDDVEDTPLTAGWDNCIQLNNNVFNCGSTQLNADYTYTFDGVTLTSGQEDPTALPVISDGNLTLGQVKAVGVSANPSSSGRFAYTNWEQSDNINLNKYYEFSITSDLGTSMTIEDIRFSVRRNGAGPVKYAVRTSANNYASNLSATITSNPNVSVAGNVFTFNVDDAFTTDINGSRITLSGASFTRVRNNTVTFRIYAWGAENELGSFEIDNLVFNGNYGSIENIQNYMEYSYCSNMFTEGQAERMRAALDLPLAGRSTLYTQQNLEFTGVENNPIEGCYPKTDFYAERIITCVGTPVQFFDHTQNSTATEHAWDFGDGITSTLRNPVVTFTTPGWKTVTYTSSNEYGTASKTKAAVYVASTPNYQSGLIQENFSNEQIFNNNFIVRNLDNNSSRFQWTSTSGYNDLGCVFINGFDMDESLIDSGDQDLDELYMPALDLSDYFGTGATFSFAYSYASRAVSTADMTDFLIVQTSADCGETWQNRTPQGSTSAQITGTNLVSAGSYNSFFTPTSVADWRTVTYTLPNTLYEENVLFRFIFGTGSYPNNLYIDNFAISGNVGIDELTAGNESFKLYPNPTANTAQVEFSLTESQDVTISVTDLSGRLVYNQLFASRNTGVNNIELPLENLTDGMYMVTIRTNNTSVSQRLVVRK
jgi:PKD repeat protein